MYHATKSRVLLQTVTSYPLAKIVDLLEECSSRKQSQILPSTCCSSWINTEASRSISLNRLANRTYTTLTVRKLPLNYHLTGMEYPAGSNLLIISEEICGVVAEYDKSRSLSLSEIFSVANVSA